MQNVAKRSRIRNQVSQQGVGEAGRESVAGSPPCGAHGSAKPGSVCEAETHGRGHSFSSLYRPELERGRAVGPRTCQDSGSITFVQTHRADASETAWHEALCPSGPIEQLAAVGPEWRVTVSSKGRT